MAQSTRFAVSVHILSVLAHWGERPVTSEVLAESVNTNAVVVRRLLGQLAEAGLVATQLGAGGGALLAKEPEAISLLDILSAVEPDRRVICTHRSDPGDHCLVGRNILEALDAPIADATQALDDSLAAVTLKAILQRIDELEARRQPTPPPTRPS